jgi:glycosidase
MNNLKLNFKTTAAILLCLTTLFMASCSKSNSGSSAIIKTTTTTTTTSGDPAQYGTPFASVPSTQNTVMYEVNINTFPNANFAGVESRLDSIKALGVNVIWLMPTYPIGMGAKEVGSPYSVQNYEGVNPAFGTLTDLRNLVAQAHSLGMAVILDWEANGSSWDNAWITANPSWYIQSGGAIQQLSTYSDVAAFNFSNPDLCQALIKAMKYWVFTANVDGYRCDFADNPPSSFWTQALDTLNTITTHKLIYLAEGTNSSEISSGFQLDYAFSYYSSIKSVFAGASASSLFSTNTSEIQSIPASGTKLRYITNHDDASSDGSTITEYGGKQGALAAFAIVSYMGGVPLIYSSQEVGYPNAINFFNVVPVDYTANPDMVAAYKQILAFRAAHIAAKIGALVQYSDPNIAAFEKTSGSDDVLILVNTKNSAETFNVPAALQNTTWINGYTGGNITFSTQYTLQPYSYIALSR